MEVVFLQLAQPCSRVLVIFHWYSAHNLLRATYIQPDPPPHILNPDRLITLSYGFVFHLR